MTMTPESELRRLRQEGTEDGYVRLDTAEEILETIMDLHEGEAREWEDAASKYEGQIEDLVSKETPLEVFSAAIQRAHERAHHVGPWGTCPNLVCASLEEWMLAARKDGQT